MIDLVKYKGYYGIIAYCQEDDLYFAKVAGIGNSSITCHGYTLDEVKEEFKTSIDFHLEVSEEEGWTPCTTDPNVAREMELLLSKKLNEDCSFVENTKLLAFAG